MNRLKRHYAALVKEAEAQCKSYVPGVSSISHHIRFWYQKTTVPNNRPAGGMAAGPHAKLDLFYTGLTICVVWLGGKEYLIGYCNLHYQDQFNKAKGRAIALGRALKRKQQVHNIPNTLYRLGAPWQLYYDKRPEKWPEHEHIVTTPMATPEERRNHKPEMFSGFKVAEETVQ